MKHPLSKVEIEQLLPFYVNGSLGEPEKQMVEAALEGDSELRKELQFLRALQMNVNSQPRDTHSPGELGLKRLQKEIGALGMIEGTQKVGKEKRWWQASAIAASVALVAVLLIDINGHYGEYDAAGGTAVENQNVLVVTFSPLATESDIRKLLLAEKLSIISGPSALGVYRLTAQEDIDSVVVTLAERTDIVESAQQE